MSLNAFIRYVESCRRLQAHTDEIRDHYDRPVEWVVSPDTVIDPATIYPEWQKCNRCGVYLWNHGAVGHAWEEWAGGCIGYPRQSAEPDTRVEDWRNDIENYDSLEPDDEVIEFNVDDQVIRRETVQERRDRLELKRRIEINRRKNMAGRSHVHRQGSGCPCRQCEARRMWH